PPPLRDIVSYPSLNLIHPLSLHDALPIFITPLLDGYEDHKELPYASSLCAACTEACPVKIPIHEQLIRHREIIVKREKMGSTSEDRKSTRLNSSHVSISYAVFCLKKKIVL